MLKIYKFSSFFRYFSITLLLFAAIFLFLWLRVPQFLLYAEQYQLFLFTFDYFAQRFEMPGGLADYLSEFVVQFYYVPLYGALLAAFVLTLAQAFLGLACRRGEMPAAAYVLSAVPSILFVGALGDENVLMSFGVALMLTNMFIYLDTLRRPTSPIIDTPVIIAGFIMLYWMAGPLAFAYVVAVGILRKSPVAAVLALAVAAGVVWGIHSLWFQQYPFLRMCLGLNYYRVPEIYPPSLFVIAVIVALLPVTTLIKTKFPDVLFYLSVTGVLFLGVIYVNGAFDSDKSRVFEYDSLVRRGSWNDILKKAERDIPVDNISLQAVNLALGMKGQLTESMFSYPQRSIESLIGQDRLDNTSQLVTAEALYRLGLTNIAFSTTFDLQEAIMNDRKSGRFMKRMAECMIINGKYDIARKYIDILDNSMFYSRWAKEAAQLLYDDGAVAAHPVYGPLRRNLFKRESFYSQPQVDKILAVLAIDDNGSNPLAWQYFLAAAMLKGDLATLTGFFDSSANLYPSSPVPRHVQEALAMYWTFSHKSFDGIPYSISPDVRQETSALAQAAMQYPDNPAAWRKAAPDSFGAYFLNLQLKASKSQQSNSGQSYSSTHE